MASAAPQQNTIAFFGATGGVGLSALRHALAAGYRCVALCRTPSKLTDQFPPATHPNLAVVQGNAHDEAAVAQCLVVPASSPPRLVDHVVFSIGGRFDFTRMTIDDPQVCRRGMDALLGALRACRARVPAGPPRGPQVTVVSTLGIKKGRDFPLLLAPLYSYMLKVPHEDKKIMEAALLRAAAEADGGVDFVVVRPSMLVDGEKPDRKVRVAVVEDMTAGADGKVLDTDGSAGYTISREDTGRWIFERLIRDEGHGFSGKGVSITW